MPKEGRGCIIKESLREFRRSGGECCFLLFVGREKVNCPARAREDGLGHDLGAPFCRVSPCGASDFARGGKVTKTPPGTRPMDYGSAMLRLGP